MAEFYIFDLDGTLSNTLQSLQYYSNLTLRLCGHPEVPPESVRTMVGSGARVLMQRLLTASMGGYSEEETERMLHTFRREYAGDPMYLVSAYQGVRETLEELIRQGKTLAVLSNKPDPQTKAITASLYPGIPFAEVRGQIPNVPRKPAPDAVFSMMRKLHFGRKDTVYIGDSEVDLETGKNAGIPVISVTWGFRSERELIRAGAGNLIDCPAELLRLRI